MPLYEYACRDCGYEFEVLRGYTAADTDAPCLRCESSQTRRKLSSFASFSSEEGGRLKPTAGAGCACAGGGSCACG